MNASYIKTLRQSQERKLILYIISKATPCLPERSLDQEMLAAIGRMSSHCLAKFLKLSEICKFYTEAKDGNHFP